MILAVTIDEEAKCPTDCPTLGHHTRIRRMLGTSIKLSRYVHHWVVAATSTESGTFRTYLQCATNCTTSTNSDNCRSVGTTLSTSHAGPSSSQCTMLRHRLSCKYNSHVIEVLHLRINLSRAVRHLAVVTADLGRQALKTCTMPHTTSSIQRLLQVPQTKRRLERAAMFRETSHIHHKHH